MAVHELAGTKVRKEDYIDLQLFMKIVILRLEITLGNSDLEKVYDSNYIYHFGIWIDKRKIRTYLNRDNYCVVDKKSYTKVPTYNEILESDKLLEKN